MSGIATAVALLAQLYVGVAARPQLPSPRVGVAARPQLPSPRVGVATSRAQEVKLNFDPKARLPVDFKLAAVSRNSAGKLYTVVLPAADEYRLAPIQLLELKGNATVVGEAYGELLATQIQEVYADWVSRKLGPNSTALVETIDWLWDCALADATPTDFLDELAGIRAGGMQAGVPELHRMAARLTTVATLPADTWNLARLVHHEVNKHGNVSTTCGRRARTLSAALHASGILSLPKTTSQRGFCDFFAAWGALTEGQRLLSSRNLDFDSNTGIAAHKLVTVYKLEGRQTYATFGYAGFMGALAGMSKPGITVSEANLDNAAVAFDGLAWPLRLRNVMGRATNLSGAEAVWAETNNTAAFNFLLGSAEDAQGVALEAISGTTGKFRGGSAIETNAQYNCTDGTVLDGVKCHWPGNPAPIRIGAPLPTAVFRSNHAMTPEVMGTQEPLWNDTVFRYYLMHDKLEEAGKQPSKLTLLGALNITALLGQKGADYGSCAPANFKTGDASNILSAVYDPSRHQALVAFEDSDKTTFKSLRGGGAAWSPAACNTYAIFDFRRWFA